MKRITLLLACWLVSGIVNAATLPQNDFFRAMHDEMQRTLKQLRLKDGPAPYYVAYWVTQPHTITISGRMGSLTPQTINWQDKKPVSLKAVVSVGSDKEDALNFVDASAMSHRFLRTMQVAAGYNAIRQGLWLLTNDVYVEVADLYQAKKAYKQKRNIHDTLPDIIPAKPGHFTEEIPPFHVSDLPRLEQTVRELSALGKELPFVENFVVKLLIQRNDMYFLNSRGAFAQYAQPSLSWNARVRFRLPNGKKETSEVSDFLTDLSDESLAQVAQQIRQFLTHAQQIYDAHEGETYIGPILLKPKAAANFLRMAILRGLQQTKPLLRGDETDGHDPSAGMLNKKRNVRISTDLLTIYDRPFMRTFEGISLGRFAPIDDEGVTPENLTLVENGKIKDIPLSQRPISQHHRSNGHGFFESMYDPIYDLRERLTNVLVEPKENLTDQQMEEKLLARCRELGLAYGYIQKDFSDAVFERIYTADGHKEIVRDLKMDGEFFTQRDLRAALAIGGTSKVVRLWGIEPIIITPSILLSEVELVPSESKPHRKPFLSRPK